MNEVTRAADWQALRAAHRWQMPARYNIARDMCEKWAAVEPDRLALIYLRPDWEVRNYSFAQLSRASNRFANALAEHGVRCGDRVAVLLPQVPETILAHLAAYKLGAIALPLFTLFGEEGLEYRLANSGARALVTDEANLPKITAIRDRLPDPARGASGRSSARRRTPSRWPTPGRRTRPSSATHLAPRGRPRGRSMPTGCCWAIPPACR
jgi:acetyl-CoA synthetase